MLPDWAKRPTFWPVSVSPTHPIDLPGLNNYGVVAPQILSRSHRPGRDHGWRELVNRRVRAVVNLESEHDDGAIPEFRESGLIPINGLRFKDETAPSDEIAVSWLSMFQSREAVSYHVHCHEGSGRTGVLCALVRIYFDGWSLEMTRREIANFRPYGNAPIIGRWLGRLNPRQSNWLDSFLKKYPPQFLK